jgi:hypothetical protein
LGLGGQNFLGDQGISFAQFVGLIADGKMIAGRDSRSWLRFEAFEKNFSHFICRAHEDQDRIDWQIQRVI